MHELSIVQSVVAACSERAGDTRVLRVTLEVGTLSCVMPDALRFCYDVAVEDTVLQGSELEIIHVPGHSRCRDCSVDVEMHDMLSTCPCGSANLERPRGGDQLLIKSMELADIDLEEIA
ncbi:MAG: hydrogenase maturation nickel metallochaperone HypA [Planctomycetes bacterium]|nr:hydrogenase maturation nickel metallochaperone HypA [Planctomycetota bacterium]